jgi:hypothetical protein
LKKLPQKRNNGIVVETIQEKNFWKVKESIIKRSVPKRQWNSGNEDAKIRQEAIGKKLLEGHGM